MKIEKQVLTIEQAKHLQELGLDMSDAALCWALGEMSFEDTTIKHQSILPMDSKPQRYHFIKEIIPTYTLQEVLDKLPVAFRPNAQDRNMLLYDSIADCQIWYENYYGTKMIHKEGDTLLEASYKMLCWVVENGYLEEDKK